MEKKIIFFFSFLLPRDNKKWKKRKKIFFWEKNVFFGNWIKTNAQSLSRFALKNNKEWEIERVGGVFLLNKSIYLEEWGQSNRY